MIAGFRRIVDHAIAVIIDAVSEQAIQIHALAANQFQLDAQPIVGLRSHGAPIAGYELLVRLRNAAGELSSPDKFLAACAVTIAVFTAALWFVRPGMVGLAMGLFIIANVGFAGGNVFIDSFLPGIANESNAGRLSGLKYGIGYMSGLASVILAGLFAAGIDNPTPELIDQARLIPVVVAAYYSVMVIPTFLFLRDRSVAQPLPPGENYVTAGFKQLRRTLTHIRRYRELVKLLGL